MGPQGGHTQQNEWREYTVNLEALVGDSLFSGPEEMHLQVQGTGSEDRGNHFIPTR